MKQHFQSQNRPKTGYNKSYYNNYNKKQGYYKSKPQYKKTRKTSEHIDPYTAQMILYRAEMYILLRYPYLINLNSKNEKILDSINEHCNFFIIKSFSEEDVHKAIKYNVWTSTKIGNQTLNNAYKKCKENGGDVYLFFSSNGSGRYVGVAKMKSEVNLNQVFPYWTQDNKWGGLFDIEWVFIKDVPFSSFKDVVFTLKDGEKKCVTNSRDTQEIPCKEAKNMLEIIKKYENTNTLLEHFEYYDMRQENYEKNNPQLLEQIKLNKEKIRKEEEKQQKE